MASDFLPPYHPVVRGGLHGDVQAAMSWSLRKDCTARDSIVDRLDHTTVLAGLEACADLALALGRRSRQLQVQERTEELERAAAALPQRINRRCAVCGRAGCAARFHPAWLDGAPA